MGMSWSIRVVWLAAAVSGAAALSACTAPASTPPSATIEAVDVAPADVMFVQMMIPHHQQAIEMSEILLSQANMPSELRGLATQIAKAQATEITQMRAWLDDWGVPEMGSMGGMGGMGGNGGMWGMLSDREMDELRAAEGEEAVSLFLARMIDHHEGAIDMIDAVIENGRHADLRALVGAMRTAQLEEIVFMTEWGAP